ncbi:MAG: sulfatase [Acidobacteriota bacterium]|nr:sulfatase [Acidobacteriota bacterium]
MLVNVPPSSRVQLASRWRMISRFTLAYAFIGFCAGLLEAGLLFFIPRASGLIRPDVQYVIWFIAPLACFIAGALLGFILGVLVSLRKGGAAAAVIFAAAGLGIAGAYVISLLAEFGVGASSILSLRVGPRTAIASFIAVFIAALILLAIFGRRRLLQTGAARARLRWLAADLIILAVLIIGVIFYATHRPFSNSGIKNAEINPHASASPAPAMPNIALIVLDTVRADHLTCYGYPRPTTPNICKLAARGVLFENAIAPSSWTLPSIASIFTGLMPHQTGANWGRAPGAAPWALARILRSKGYETAGFNANPYYGLAGWRLSNGFDIYEDDSYSLRHNLAVTLVGQSAAQYLYDHLFRYNQFNHRTAADVNRDVVRWARGRDPSLPYFLFINYMDAHRPYLPPPPYDHRFGAISRGLLSRLVEPLDDGRPRSPYTPEDRAQMIDSYDNSLAYLDAQAGRLVDFLSRLPGGGRTIFIVTSDHGEGFGEHETYDHGWNLYREVLHVPLIMAGPGIPAAQRIAALVPNRELFSTILDLTLGLKGVVEQTSLRRDWESSSAAGPGGHQPAAAAPSAGVLSELDVFSRGTDPASISLAAAQWRLIVNSGRETELYDVENDPQEKTNLAADPTLRGTLASLRGEMEARLAYSLLPWRATDYLAPLDRPDAPFIQRISGHPPLPAAGIPIGAAQAIFSHAPPSQLIRPSPSQQETLRALPYH